MKLKEVKIVAFWKSSKSHTSKSMGGKEHFDVYRTNSSGKRDMPHSKDIKISGKSHSPSMRDVHSPKK